MEIEIINTPITLALHGFSDVAHNNDHGDVAFKLMDRMWKVVKGSNLKNKGINVWVYEPGHEVFAGVELEERPSADTELEQKTVILSKYAYYKHVGPYHLIKQMTQAMKKEMASQELYENHISIEMYGHWNSDETKLETELLFGLA